MGQAEVPFHNPCLFSELCRNALQTDVRTPPGIGDHFDVRPGQTGSKPPSECLEHRLLRGESSGIPLRTPNAPFFTVRLFPNGETPIEKSRLMPGDQVVDTLDADQVDTVSKDPHVCEDNDPTRGTQA